MRGAADFIWGPQRVRDMYRQRAIRRILRTMSYKHGGDCVDGLLWKAGARNCPLADLGEVEVWGIPLGYTHAVSIDQNGDLVVDGADLAIVQSKVGTSDMTADFDGDGPGHRCRRRDRDGTPGTSCCQWHEGRSSRNSVRRGPVGAAAEPVPKRGTIWPDARGRCGCGRVGPRSRRAAS